VLSAVADQNDIDMSNDDGTSDLGEQQEIQGEELTVRNKKQSGIDYNKSIRLDYFLSP
jgi:hypothetical protein